MICSLNRLLRRSRLAVWSAGMPLQVKPKELPQTL